MRTAVLVSGGGTNLQALIDAKAAGEMNHCDLCLVVSSRADARALERARRAGIEAVTLPRREYASNASYSDALRRVLKARRIDMIVLAGFLCILSPEFCSAYEGRILNVHPSLIPSFCGEGFYGLRVHEAALARGVRVTGATVHLVSEVTDGGEILLQKAVPVQPGDTPETLQRRVMEQAEWVLLPRAAEMVAARLEEQAARKTENTAQSACTDRMGAMEGTTVGKGKVNELGALLRGNSYPGRGIVLGRSADGENAVVAYFIMGRSENSRNRVFVTDGDGLRTQAFDPEKLTDPSLIIYAPVRVLGERTIVTNGDQTDTICDTLALGGTFEDALRTRTFEPDSPNFTPRISGLISGTDYRLSILKSQGGDPEVTQRGFYEVTHQKPGLGHFIHTYRCDGDPIPSYEGEPECVAVEGDLDAFTRQIWENLNPEHRVSLFTRFINLKTGAFESRIINKNQRPAAGE